MRLLNAPLLGLSWFQDALGLMEKKNTCFQVNGCVDSEKLHMINALAASVDAAIIVTYSETKAREIYDEYSFYDKNVLYYPAKDLIFYQADINGRQLSIDRMRAMKSILRDKKMTIVTTIDAFMSPMLPLDVINKNILEVQKGSILEEQAVALMLVEMGYEKNYQIEAPGQFSIRGGIIDVFDLTQENPYRIELWGDEVESIRSFDILSQRSIEELDEIAVYPGAEMILTKEQKLLGWKKIETEVKALEEKYREEFKTEEAFRLKVQLEELRTQLLETDMMLNLESYIHYFYSETTTFLELLGNKNFCVFMDEPIRVLDHAKAVELEFRESMMHRLEKGYALPGQAKLLRSAEETIVEAGRKKCACFSGLQMENSVYEYDANFEVNTRSMASYNGSFLNLASELKKLKKSGYRVVILSPSRSRAKRLAEDLTQEEVITSYTENEDRRLQAGEVVTFYGHIHKGYEYPDIKFMVIAETDIFGKEKKRKQRKKKFAAGQKIKDYGMLKVGDYVIHENYGIGIYQGIEKVEVDRIQKDYMKISYRDGGNLYVLATSLEMISLYADKDGKPPKLNKLGTQEWNKTKAKVQGAVTDVAKDLVHLYAVRQAKSGYTFGKDTVWQKEFEELFPYEETDDQLSAIDATKDDMESTKIMDRLVCGDVGFGKTEIAIRAAFKAVQEGKQVAYLVPTTILAQQHFNNFVMRMKDYPIKIAMLSRFCTTKEIKKTLEELKKGLVDIVIGTHRLLSKDVEFHDLGLLVVDEEQRFGVNHKERIKQLKEDVDVLTLTATPIPRTLHMSLVGIRDMSLLEEAPQDRLPIQTYVMEYNEEMVREAITRELARGGQVYYVYNRIEGIDRIAAKIAELIPQANVAFAHGQMGENQLEDIMMDFINNEINVLVCTTIIETGLDIPNVNTMIIHDSDTLGLSQLYQLRGRVGRSNRTSYAFLMYRRDKVLREVAEKRLMAIKEFTELGSGFKIAMRDLEIRGAGNLLGKKQHGHMQAVGYDLYCKMLEEAVQKEQGIPKEAKQRSTTIDLNVDAFIPPAYIVNEVQKLDIYKRIAAIESPQDCEDMRDELKDRFGNVPREAENLLRIASLKIKARERFISEMKGRAGHIRVVMPKDAPVIVDEISGFLYSYGGDLKLQTVGDPEFILKYDIAGLVEKDEQLLLEKAEELLENMAVLFQKSE